MSLFIESIAKFEEDIRGIIENIEQHVLFVKKEDTEGNVIEQTKTITIAHSPMIFIVSGISSAAATVRNCETKLKEVLTDYELEKISSGEKENLFFKRVL